MPSPLVRVPSEIAPLVQQLCKQFRQGQTDAVAAGLAALLADLEGKPASRRTGGRAAAPATTEPRLQERLESLERRLAALESPDSGPRSGVIPLAAGGEDSPRFDLTQLRQVPETPGETLGEDALARRLGLPRSELRRLREAGYRHLEDGDRTATYLGRKGRGAAHLWCLISPAHG